MAFHNIEDIPANIRRELENILDNHLTLNWYTLISHIPGQMYQKYQIEGFRMKTLEPGGSPANALLNDLSIRRVKVQQLVLWLNKMILQEPYPRLQALLLKLQGRNEPLTITRQPDSLYKFPMGSSLYMKCEALPSIGVSYQWFKRKNLLSGKTQSYLHLEDLGKEDEGKYICRVSMDDQNFLFSKWAKLEIMEPSHGMAKPIITTQPHCAAGQSVLGGILHLYCDAVGDPAPSFQWYKDNIPIHGAASRDFNKANLCHDDEGIYLCVASNSAGQTFSERTTVKVSKSDPMPRPINRGPINRVSDKVALLIGNREYKDQRLGPLYHPTNDVCDLAGPLTSIGFKVVSLVNLTLTEMRFAVKQFYEMLDKDMYALFYFAGHGFEIGNQSYLMPVDASPSYRPGENLSASEVINSMQKSQAKLNIVMLDSCRTQPNRVVVNPTEGIQVKETNVMIVFPCCSKNSVFESESHTNGFFAYYLLQHIGDNVSISEVILRVSGGIDKEDIRDPNTGQKQIVYTHSTITEQLSLTAPVDLNAPTLKSSELWKAAHELPQTPVQVFKENDCVVELLFFAEFSNVLLVHARLLGDGDHAFILEPDIHNGKHKRVKGCIYERINEKDPTVPDNFPRTDCLTQAIRIKDLQRLKGNLEIELEVSIASEPKYKTRRIKYKMETKPLYAKVVQP